jgi:hypothetical protein
LGGIVSNQQWGQGWPEPTRPRGDWRKTFVIFIASFFVVFIAVVAARGQRQAGRGCGADGGVECGSDGRG